MKAVGIISYITYSSHLNYGATLHGYAFQRVLKEKFGVDSKIINYIPRLLEKENLRYPFLNPWKIKLKDKSFIGGVSG